MPCDELQADGLQADGLPCLSHEVSITRGGGAGVVGVQVRRGP